MNKQKQNKRHAVSRAKARLARLVARGARPRSINRAEVALEARKAVQETQREQVAQARRELTKMVDEAFSE